VQTTGDSQTRHDLFNCEFQSWCLLGSTLRLTVKLTAVSHRAIDTELRADPKPNTNTAGLRLESNSLRIGDHLTNKKQASLIIILESV